MELREEQRNKTVNVDEKSEIRTEETLVSDFLKTPKKFLVQKKNNGTLYSCFFVFVLITVNIGIVFNGYIISSINRYRSTIDIFYNASIMKGSFQPTINTEFHWGLIASGSHFGSVPGALAAAWLSDYFGRRKTMLFNIVFNITAALMSFFSVTKDYFSPHVFLAARIVAGVNMGVNIIVVPTYLMEISPTSIRGGVGILIDLGYGIGFVLGYIMGLTEILGTLPYWGWLFGGYILFVPVQVVMLLLCPESPRHLLIKCNKEELTRAILKRLRGHDHIENELEEMRTEAEMMKQESVGVIGLLKTRHLWKLILIGCLTQLIQQLHGVVIIYLYSNMIFQRAGISAEIAGYSSLGIGFTSFLTQIVAFKLIDRRGRKELLIAGLLGVQFCFILLTITFIYSQYLWARILAVISSILCNIFSSLGPFPIPWFIVAEMFPQGSRAAAMSFCSFISRITGIIVILTFPLLQNILGVYVFIPFISICLLFTLLTKFCIPETKGRTFLDIFQELTVTS